MSAVETTPATSRRRSSVFPRGRGAPPAGGTPQRRRRLVPRWLPYSLSGPALLAIGLIIGAPLVVNVLESFQHYTSFNLIQGIAGAWTGFTNYRDLVTTGGLLQVLYQTLLFTISTVGGTLIIGFALALLMQRASHRAQVFLSVSLVVCWAIPQVASTEVFIQLFNGAYGAIAWLLSGLHINFPNARHDWFANGQVQLMMAAIMVIWGAVPFVALALFAGLLQIPEDLYEAARVDGASFLAQMRLVTVPLLLPILMLLTVLSVIWDAGVFNQVYIVDRAGGIGENTTLGVFIFQVGIGQANYGEGAAAGVVATVLIGFVIFFAVRQMVKSTGPM